MVWMHHTSLVNTEVQEDHFTATQNTSMNLTKLPQEDTRENSELPQAMCRPSLSDSPAPDGL
jgi:hypothetical protein